MADAPDAAKLRLKALVSPVKARLSRAGGLVVAAELLWIPQAGVIALGLGGLLDAGATALDPFLAAGLFALLGLLRHGLDAWAARLTFEAADAVVAGARAELVAAESLRSPQDGARPASAEIAALAGEKLAALRPYLLRYRPAQLRVMTVPFVIAVAAVLPVSWAVFLILMVAGPLIPVFMALVGFAAREASEKQMVEVGQLNALLLERLAALVDIRLLDARARAVSGFAAAADGLRARTMAVLRIAFLSSTVLELFSALGVAMVAVYVGFALLGEIGFGAWATPLDLREGIFVLMLAPAFFQPLRDLAAAWHDRAAAVAVAGELAARDESRARRILGQGSATEPLPGPAAIAIRGLSYITPAGRRIAWPDFEVAPGESLAILGPSGIGKSALLALLGGLAAAEVGEIRVADVPLADDTADAWRARLGWVGQAPHFLEASLRVNLTLGAGKVAEARLAEALALAEAGEIVARLPHGLGARLGEAGAGVSGGEARRLMVARAALRAPDVILADEPTADLDARTAASVTEGLLRLNAGGATLIVATHDPALAARMGRQIRLAEAEA
ncbi:MAG: ATP-binding cassette domain-containing protein [Rhodobacteraceae bacterium]|nr:ATP-binding cassette domain-containing protein [Paracoccaceae bacterium]